MCRTASVVTASVGEPNLQGGSYGGDSDQKGLNNQGAAVPNQNNGGGYNQNNGGGQNGGGGYGQNGGYPQQQNYPEPTRPSRLKHIIKSAVQGAIMGAAASAAAAAMQSNNGKK